MLRSNLRKLLLIISAVALLASSTIRAEGECFDCVEELQACDLAFTAMEARYLAAERLLKEQQELIEEQATQVSSDDDWLKWLLLGVIAGGVAGSQL